MPRLEACYFERPPAAFGRLAAVLRLSASRHCAGWAINVRELEAPARRDFAAANTWKLDEWAAVVRDAADGERLVLMDVDTMVLRPLDAVWDLDFDVAYTVKAAPRRPFNAGVIFLRATQAARAFVAVWQEENRRLYGDEQERQVWASRFVGMNQASLGSLLIRSVPERLGVRLLRLPCREWNCEDSSWHRFDPKVTRIVHVKGELGRELFRATPLYPDLSRLVATWKGFDSEARRGCVAEFV